MINKCKDCPIYEEKLEETLKKCNSGFDIMLEMNDFIKNCNCENNLKDEGEHTNDPNGTL